MKKWLKMIKNEKGLTLIELLAVVVILGIIAAIAVPSISNIIDNSKKDAHVANALLIVNAAKLAVVSNDSVVIDKLVGDKGASLEDLVKGGYLDAVPKDPDGKGAYNKTSLVKYTKGTAATTGTAATNNAYRITLIGSKKQIVDASEADLNNKDRDELVTETP